MNDKQRPTHQKIRRIGVALASLTLAVGTAGLGSVAFAGPAAAEPGGNSANAETCQQDGWQTAEGTDGTLFVTPGDCVSYAAQGGVFTARYPESKSLCESYAGTFVGGVYPTLWGCEGWTAVDRYEVLDRWNALRASCLADGGEALNQPTSPPVDSYCTVSA